MRVLITGSAGYIGSLLLERFASDSRITAITAIDLLPSPRRAVNLGKNSSKVGWITHDLAKDGWQGEALRNGRPDIAIHAAFKIRNPFGRIGRTRAANLTACQKIFMFCFEQRIPKLIYLSSVAAYGAKAENIGRMLAETEELLERRSPYGSQKREVETLLRNLVHEIHPRAETSVLRLNSVTGPVGQGMKSKVGLITFLKKILPFVVEANPAWGRQFVHEQDVIDAIYHLALRPPQEGALTAYNIAPPGYLTARDMARVMRKRIIRVRPKFVAAAFRIAWCLGLGVFPTPPGSEGGLIYPINVNGRFVETTGFRYRFSSEDAFLARQ